MNASFSPKSDWEIAMSVLEEKKMPLEQFVYPEKHRDQPTIALRSKVIKIMNERGISRNRLTSLTPFSRRHIDRILQNGSGASQECPSLDFHDDLPIIAAFRDKRGASAKYAPRTERANMNPTREKFYAIRIGDPRRHYCYFQANSLTGLPQLYHTREQAERFRPKKGPTRAVRVWVTTETKGKLCK